MNTNPIIQEVNSSIAHHKYTGALKPVGLCLVGFNVLAVVMFLWFSPSGFPWFIYTMYASALGFSIFFVVGSPFFAGHKDMFIHGLFTALTSTVLVFTNEHAYDPEASSHAHANLRVFPWSAYPVILLVTAVVIHALIKYRSLETSRTLFNIHATLFTATQSIILVSWAYGYRGRFPFFLITIFVFGCALLAHWVILKIKAKKQQSQLQQPPVQTEVAQQNISGGVQTFVQHAPVQYPQQFVGQPQQYMIQPYQQQTLVYPQVQDPNVPVQQPTTMIYPSNNV
ncbi:6 TM domain-containing transmembrane protein [Acrasis kona]|uniref:6 TM domain-containing transmembrane protein n=1 Tax=Acrasis kona TaxID=1008807 RepID=A0AAW2YHN6_9EUKA